MKYYVVYTTGGMIGSCTIDLELPVRNTKDVMLIADYVKEYEKTSSIVILNWKELEG